MSDDVLVLSRKGRLAELWDSTAWRVGLFRAASDTDALELFQDLLDVTRDFMGMLGELRSRHTDGALPEFAQKTEKFSNMLSEMGDVLENEDWILLADLLEYEFIPQCDEWRSTSEVLHRQVIEHVAQ